MVDISFEASLDAINRATHYDTLWEAFIAAMNKGGADLVTYHHIAPHHAADAGRIDVLNHGFPRAWQKYCRDEDLAAHDPIFNMAYIHTDIIKWSDIFKAPPIGEAEKNYIAHIKEWMKGDGYVMPVFGPSGRNGYISVGNSASIQDWTPIHICQLSCLCQHFHIHYTKLRISELPNNFSLDDKEHEILNIMATGHSPQSAADLLGIKPETVNAALDRLMLSMGVSDLASLMIRAESLGLISTA